MPKQRENLEQRALERFEKIAQKHGYQAIRGQGSDNQIPVKGKTYFQFGDLRVDTKTHHVVVEVESAGGVTNLAKYWFCLEKRSKTIKKPVILLHLFRQSSKADYGSHLDLWEFLWDEMSKKLGDRMKATCHPYSNSRELEAAINEFEKYLR